MKDENDNTIEGRKAQESLKNFITAGYFKTVCEAQKAMYDEYIRIGFEPEQALTLTITMTKSQAS
jgi:hypothetical protein